MIAFLIGVAVLVYIWRRVSVPVHVIQPPTPMTVTVLTPSIVIHVHNQNRLP